jgi:lipopolysaccharide biosynthesis regulator YciM
MARGMNEPEELIFAAHGVGRMHLIQGNPDVAVEALEPALTMCKSAEFPIYVPRIASCLGAAYASLGRTDEALVLLEEAVRQAAASNLTFGQSLGRVNNQSFGANAQASCAKAMKLRASLS